VDETANKRPKTKETENKEDRKKKKLPKGKAQRYSDFGTQMFQYELIFFFRKLATTESGQPSSAHESMR
jgi:hypothetical protein